MGLSSWVGVFEVRGGARGEAGGGAVGLGGAQGGVGGAWRVGLSLWVGGLGVGVFRVGGFKFGVVFLGGRLWVWRAQGDLSGATGVWVTSHQRGPQSP